VDQEEGSAAQAVALNHSTARGAQACSVGWNRCTGVRNFPRPGGAGQCNAGGGWRAIEQLRFVWLKLGSFATENLGVPDSQE
jgi:hypothetical protein